MRKTAILIDNSSFPLPGGEGLEVGALLHSTEWTA
jgi:hypothetical protein